MSAFILNDRYFDPESVRISSYFCQLFVLLGQQSVQYSILDTEKNTFIALAGYRLPSPSKIPEAFFTRLDQLLSEEAMLLKKYPSVVIGIDTSLHTLVPSSLLETGQEKNYLEFNFRIPDGCQIRSDRVEEIDAFNIYGFLPGLQDIIFQHFRESSIVHRSTALIRAAYHHHKIHPDPSCVFLHIRDHYIDLVIFEGNRLAFFNSFPFHSKEDILYFTLYTIGQLKLHPDSVQLFISGMIDAGSDSFLLLEQYFRMISFTGPINSFSYSALLSQAPLHRYQELFALALCGS